MCLKREILKVQLRDNFGLKLNLQALLNQLIYTYNILTIYLIYSIVCADSVKLSCNGVRSGLDGNGRRGSPQVCRSHPAEAQRETKSRDCMLNIPVATTTFTETAEERDQTHSLRSLCFCLSMAGSSLLAPIHTETIWSKSCQEKLILA